MSADQRPTAEKDAAYWYQRADDLMDALNDTDAMRCCSCPSCNYYALDYDEHKDEPCQTWELVRAWADANCRATHVFPPERRTDA